MPHDHITADPRLISGGVRAIVSKGWSARMSKGGDEDVDVVLPEECYSVRTRCLHFILAC